jgi:phosphatidylglycerol:prolipoprotein diacylglycerol transferase
MFAVAVIAATWITERRSKDRPLARKTCLLAVLGGILGARGWYSAQYGLGSAGMSSYGFMIGVVAAAVIYRRLHGGRWEMGELPDTTAPAVLLGASLVRVGCFVHGCCYGKPSDLPWAVTYGPSTPAYRTQLTQGLIQASAPSTLPVHPTQLYEALFAAAVSVVILVKGRNLGLSRHCLLLLTAVLYAAFRFLIEFVRDDSGGAHFGPLTFAQGSSLVVLVTALALISWRIRVEQPAKGREAEPA